MMTFISTVANVSERDNFSADAMFLKLAEEHGELAEALNHHLGRLPHKQMKEPLIGEVADVIICAISVLQKAHPDLTISQLDEQLTAMILKKNEKWEHIINDRLMKEAETNPIEGVFIREGDEIKWHRVAWLNSESSETEIRDFIEEVLHSKQYQDSDHSYFEHVEVFFNGKLLCGLGDYTSFGGGSLFNVYIGTYDEINSWLAQMGYNDFGIQKELQNRSRVPLIPKYIGADW